MNPKPYLLIFALFSILLAACAPALNVNPPAISETPAPALEEQPAAQETLSMQEMETAESAPAVEQTLITGQEPPGGARNEFSTDFSKTIVNYDEILSGGPPKDGIPSIDQPAFVTVAEADEWLADVEPVILVEAGGEAKAYPIQILMWHEIVNDTLGGVPVSVTFCPLCNTAIAFERTFDGRVLDFGTTGRLRFSNLIMYDRQTETWWQQATGQAIAGELTGSQLIFYPAAIIAWQDFRSSYPQGEVLSRETGLGRPYGQNPYAGYDDVNRPPFLYDGPPTPGVLLPMARVLTLEWNGESVAYPYDLLREVSVINDEVGGQPIAIFWTPGTASALDSREIALGRDIGTAAAFSREVNGQVLTFVSKEGQIVDNASGRSWDIFGRASSGELLTPVVSVNHFWFSWAAFQPDTRIYQP